MGAIPFCLTILSVPKCPLINPKPVGKVGLTDATCEQPLQAPLRKIAPDRTLAVFYESCKGVPVMPAGE